MADQGDRTGNQELVAFCGLYCGACRSYVRGSCPGCRKNEAATWCGIRKCCLAGGLSSCAACTKHQDPHECRDFHNLISRVIGFFLHSDRRACILQIRRLGLAGHADEMARLNRQSLPRV